LSDFAVQRVFTIDQKMTESRKLLKEYVSSRSEAAFRELAERYVNLVYSVALRLAGGDTHLAEDVTQTVFADLAVMASKLPAGCISTPVSSRPKSFVPNAIVEYAKRPQRK
jgi:hypothetical protein